MKVIVHNEAGEPYELAEADWERLQQLNVVTMAGTSPAAPKPKPDTPGDAHIDSIDTSWDTNDNPVGEVEPAEAELPDLDDSAIPFGPSPFIHEGVPTSDGRMIQPGALTVRPLPHTFMLQTETDEKHKGARVQGRIDSWELVNGTWMATGFYVGPVGCEGAELARSKVMRGVSGDVAAQEIELVVLEVDDDGMPSAYQEVVTKGEIMGATQTPFPAFADCEVTVGEEPASQVEAPSPINMPGPGLEPFVAAAAPVRPPADWFANPQLEGPTPLQLSDDGQVFGHIAEWGTCHIGYDACLTAPTSPSSYAYFLTGQLECDDGTRINVGTLTFDTGHADTERPIGYQMAQSHYDNTATAAADVTCGEDEFGVWVAGALRPKLSDEQRREFLAAKPSGDWRKIQGNLEMVACLMVNTPGLPIPRATLVASATGEMEQVALVAAAAPVNKASRDEMAKSGVAMPDGSFPIPDESHLKSAIRLARTDAQRKHVIKRAKALGKSDLIPDTWTPSGGHTGASALPRVLLELAAERLDSEVLGDS